MNSSPVVVVGSGVAGFTAAVTAAHGGADVLLLEKSDVFGGTTAISGGALWIPESSRAKTAGMDDSCERRPHTLTSSKQLWASRGQSRLIVSIIGADLFMHDGPIQNAIISN